MKQNQRKIEIMGIVNLTDDSFYAQSRVLTGNGEPDIPRLLSTVEEMLYAGADIIDLGACSTRPGSEPVGASVEWKRLRPAILSLKEHFPDVRISVDTYWASVVRNVCQTIGEFIVNDITAGSADPEMLKTVGALKLPYIAMHLRGMPDTMASLTQYSDVVSEVMDYFKEFASVALDNGITDWILDPGFGFAKTTQQNFELLDHLDTFTTLGHRILVGISRKSMIYKTLDTTPENSLEATEALHLLALSKGADILRVHDVAPAVQIVKLYRKMSEDLPDTDGKGNFRP